MKKTILIAVAILATMTALAQNIAVVNPSNKTTLYESLDEAINEADPGSVIYLPGGSLRISNDTKVTKKLTIMGVSHRVDVDNADGATLISGNISFDSGSDGSALMGVYLTGNVNIGSAEASVDNVLVRYCDMNEYYVHNSQCNGLKLNQCYIRNGVHGGSSKAQVTNCILKWVEYINEGDISNNIIWFTRNDFDSFFYISGSTIYKNIIIDPGRRVDYGCSNNLTLRNMFRNVDWGTDCVNLQGVEWKDVFEDPSYGINYRSNFKFKTAYQQYNDIGIYGGETGFSDSQLAPMPRIVSKKVNERTDGTGKLQIEVTVKAN